MEPQPTVSISRYSPDLAKSGGCISTKTKLSKWRVLLTIVLKDKLTGLRAWEDNDRLPDSFFSRVAIEEMVGPGPLDHNGEAETLPYFSAIPYLQLVLGHVPIGHPVAQPLPDGDYDIVFAGWFAGIAFLCLKHDFKLAHVGSTIFATSNWAAGGDKL